MRRRILGSVAAQGGHADGVGRAQARARAQAFACGQDILVEVNEMWTHWGLSPGPSACGADVIPLHHVPDAKMVGAWLLLVSDLCLILHRSVSKGVVAARLKPL